MSTQFNLNRDLTGAPAYSPPFAEDNKQVTLSAGAAQTMTVPSNYSVWEVMFSFGPGKEVWVANNHTATLPSGSVAATFSQLNPSSRFVNKGDVLSFITNDTTATVGASFYAVSL